jgi:hypothetical protein
MGVGHRDGVTKLCHEQNIFIEQIGRRFLCLVFRWSWRRQMTPGEPTDTNEEQH